MPAILAIAATLLGGCASTPDARELRSEPLRFKTTEGAPDVVDRRSDFRAVFRDELRKEGLATGDDARRTIEITLAIERSLQTTAPVRLPLAA